MITPMLANPLVFESGQTAQAVYMQQGDAIEAALSALQLPKSRPVLVIIGGAGNLTASEFNSLEQLFLDSLAPLAEELGMIVLDGGTDAGVIRLMGQARSATQATFPLLGIAPIGKVHLPHQAVSTATHALEPHHSHFILVPGSAWGDESSWIAEAASILSQAAPSVTLLINGGNISLVDVTASVAASRPVVVVTGTGRLADEIATAIRHPETKVREALSPLLKTGRFSLFDRSKSKVHLRSFLRKYFFKRISANLTPGFNL